MKVLFAFALALALTPLAVAQTTAPTQQIRGTIVSLDGNVLMVKDASQTRRVVLAETPRIAYIVPADLAKITPGTLIGSAALPQPDGSLRALEVHLLPPNVAPRISPYDLQANSVMANAAVKTQAAAIVDKVEGRTLTIDIGGTEKILFVPTGTPVVGSQPADRSALVPGAKVTVLNASRRDDGSFAATVVQVGKDGLTPPM